MCVCVCVCACVCVCVCVCMCMCVCEVADACNSYIIQFVIIRPTLIIINGRIIALCVYMCMDGWISTVMYMCKKNRVRIHSHCLSTPLLSMISNQSTSYVCMFAACESLLRGNPIVK